MLARPLGTRENREIAVDDKENSFRPQAHYGRRRSAVHDFAHLNGTCVGSCDRHDGGIGGSSVAKVPPLNLGPLQSASAVQPSAYTPSHHIDTIELTHVLAGDVSAAKKSRERFLVDAVEQTPVQGGEHCSSAGKSSHEQYSLSSQDSTSESPNYYFGTMEECELKSILRRQYKRANSGIIVSSVPTPSKAEQRCAQIGRRMKKSQPHVSCQSEETGRVKHVLSFHEALATPRQDAHAARAHETAQEAAREAFEAFNDAAARLSDVHETAHDELSKVFQEMQSPSSQKNDPGACQDYARTPSLSPSEAEGQARAGRAGDTGMIIRNLAKVASGDERAEELLLDLKGLKEELASAEDDCERAIRKHLDFQPKPSEISPGYLDVGSPDAGLEATLEASLVPDTRAATICNTVTICRRVTPRVMAVTPFNNLKSRQADVENEKGDWDLRTPALIRMCEARRNSLSQSRVYQSALNYFEEVRAAALLRDHWHRWCNAVQEVRRGKTVAAEVDALNALPKCEPKIAAAFSWDQQAIPGQLVSTRSISDIQEGQENFMPYPTQSAGTSTCIKMDEMIHFSAVSHDSFTSSRHVISGYERPADAFQSQEQHWRENSGKHKPAQSHQAFKRNGKILGQRVETMTPNGSIKFVPVPLSYIGTDDKNQAANALCTQALAGDATTNSILVDECLQATTRTHVDTKDTRWPIAVAADCTVLANQSRSESAAASRHGRIFAPRSRISGADSFYADSGILSQMAHARHTLTNGPCPHAITSANDWQRQNRLLSQRVNEVLTLTSSRGARSLSRPDRQTLNTTRHPNCW